jgi:Protein of unknown function, DUF481
MKAVTRAAVVAILILGGCPKLCEARPPRDILVMRNGDRITCEVKSLEGAVLKVDLEYVDGTMSIDWLKVARLESNYLFIVTMQDGSIYSTKIVTPEMPAGPIVKMELQPDDGRAPLQVNRSEVVRISQTSDEFLRRFNGSITMGATYAKGNNATQYNFGSDLNYQRARWGATARFNSNLSSNTGARTSTRNQLDFGAHRLLAWRNYFVGGIATFLQSSVQGVHLQTSLGAGLGRYLKNTNRFRIWVLGGGGWQETRYIPSVVDQPPQSIGVALLSSDLEAFAFKKTRLSITSTVFPALTTQAGRVFYKANASYYIKLFRKIDWDVSFYGNWDTNPPPQFRGSDYGGSTGLSWTFGNR